MALLKEDWEWLSQHEIRSHSFVHSLQVAITPLVSSAGNNNSLIARQWRDAVVSHLQDQVDRLASHRICRHEHKCIQTVGVIDFYRIWIGSRLKILPPQCREVAIAG